MSGVLSELTLSLLLGEVTEVALGEVTEVALGEVTEVNLLLGEVGKLKEPTLDILALMFVISMAPFVFQERAINAK